MKRLRLFVATIGIALMGFVGYNAYNGDASFAETPECGDNSILRCGAMSSADLKAKYAANDRDTQAIYSHYGITSADIAASTSARTGVVNTDGTVVVDGKVVATGAHTVGRSSSLGGWAVKIDSSTTVYEGTGRLKSPLSAYVFFDANGNFKVAILKVCGNPVPATPVAKPVYRCDTLTSSAATIVAGKSVTFTTKATAEGGATISGYTYTFGDSSTANAGATTSHTYTKPGTYTASVAVAVSVDGKVVTAPGSCTVQVVVTPVMCDVPGKEQYPKDDPRCFADKPAISITKTVNKTEHAKVKVGDSFTYEITVTNTGNVSLKDAVVTDNAPSEVTLLSSSDNLGSIKSNVWTYTIPELKVKETRTFVLTAKYAKYAVGTHKNTVCVDTPTITGSPDGCDDATTETYENITVCDLTDNTIKTIDRSAYDESHMTTDQTKCGNMHVCVIADKVEKDIAKKDYDDKTMTTDMSKCAPEPVPELPHTGIADAFGGVIGIGGLVGVGLAYAASRRAVR